MADHENDGSETTLSITTSPRGRAGMRHAVAAFIVNISPYNHRCASHDMQNFYDSFMCGDVLHRWPACFHLRAGPEVSLEFIQV
jgi:hypothetical protein